MPVDRAKIAVACATSAQPPLPTATVAPSPIPTPPTTATPSPIPTHAHPTATPTSGTAHPMGCKDDEIFVSGESWWLPDTGHGHLALCWPWQRQISGQITLTLRTTMFHNPGTLYRVYVTVIDAPQDDGNVHSGQMMIYFFVRN